MERASNEDKLGMLTEASVGGLAMKAPLFHMLLCYTPRFSAERRDTVQEPGVCHLYYVRTQTCKTCRDPSACTRLEIGEFHGTGDAHSSWLSLQFRGVLHARVECYFDRRELYLKSWLCQGRGVC